MTLQELRNLDQGLMTWPYDWTMGGVSAVELIHWVDDGLKKKLYPLDYPSRHKPDLALEDS